MNFDLFWIKQWLINNSMLTLPAIPGEKWRSKIFFTFWLMLEKRGLLFFAWGHLRSSIRFGNQMGLMLTVTLEIAKDGPWPVMVSGTLCPAVGDGDCWCFWKFSQENTAQEGGIVIDWPADWRTERWINRSDGITCSRARLNVFCRLIFGYRL